MVTLGSIAFTMIFSLLAADTMTIVYKDHSLQLGKTPSVLLREILRAHWIFIIVGGIAVSIISVLLTHHFAGPSSPLKKKTSPPPADGVETRNALNRTRAFSGQLKDAISKDEVVQLMDIILQHLSQFSPLLPEESRKTLKETLDILEQARTIETRLNEILSSSAWAASPIL